LGSVGARGKARGSRTAGGSTVKGKQLQFVKNDEFFKVFEQQFWVLLSSNDLKDPKAAALSNHSYEIMKYDAGIIAGTITTKQYAERRDLWEGIGSGASDPTMWGNFVFEGDLAIRLYDASSSLLRALKVDARSNLEQVQAKLRALALAP
jgi:hypothetical protein